MKLNKLVTEITDWYYRMCIDVAILLQEMAQKYRNLSNALEHAIDMTLELINDGLGDIA